MQLPKCFVPLAIRSALSAYVIWKEDAPPPPNKEEALKCLWAHLMKCKVNYVRWKLAGFSCVFKIRWVGKKN